MSLYNCWNDQNLKHYQTLPIFEPYSMSSSTLTEDLDTQWGGGRVNVRKVRQNLSIIKYFNKPSLTRDYHVLVLSGKTTVN